MWAPAPYPETADPEGVLVLSRLPIAAASVAQFDSAPGDPAWLGAKRAAARVVVAVNGREVNVFFTHLDTNTSNRNSQLNQLLSWVSAIAVFETQRSDHHAVILWVAVQ